jgi:hypothetical protein
LYQLGGETLTRDQRRALTALVEEAGAMIRVAPGLIATDVFPPAALASLVGSVTEAHAQLRAVTESATDRTHLPIPSPRKSRR